ncbi:glycoside hydrolase family 78 protein [Salinibacterium soli]|uniref:alpha-L-rhamnosidase n=1 Tax=Antiquaquibacter soli TaxID=3064523 RepID=A0ABT9BLR6_9MICO|nr:glycoside hydrolase family 78 protein [Protaetiibacter sp. WY-16]MDO7880721.1 glycoside hydrolase family 78 protein [Protaetiibacter sp. WY-16]
MATPSSPRFEHHREALGIGEAAPRLSWKTVAPAGWRQAAYEVEVTRSQRVHTERIESGESVLVPWVGAPLESRESASVRVRVVGESGDESDWSEASVVEAGLLHPTDWVAVPVGAPWDEGDDLDARRPPLVRRGFTLGKPVAKARLYASAHGLYEVELNGSRVGDDALAPGWTVYGQRLRYYTYDVTGLLQPGENAIGSWLGDGWYRGRLGWRGGFYNLFGSDLALLAQLEVTYADGSVETIATDDSWRAHVGPIVRSGLYDGEVYDARDELPGWSAASFDDSGWSPVATGERDPATLVAPQGPPVRCTEELAPVAVLTTPSGKRILDFGQNFAGRIRIRVSGAAGDTVTIRTAEVLQHGELYTRPLREAKSTDVYTLRGEGTEEWEPRFTIHGFRYAEVTGWPGDLDAAVAAGDAVGRVYHSDMERTGWFESSNPLVNRLHDNVLWGMRSNFVDVPTDCPQRDERVGWTGDIQVFAPTAAFLYDVSGMLGSWLRDVAVEQLPDGTIPWYVPVIPAHQMWTPIRPGAVWGDVAVLTPWVLYERSGDAGILAAQYESAKKWVDLQDRLAGDDHLWNEGFQLGDWLDPDAPPQDPADAKTDKYLVATAYFAWSARHLAKAAEVLGLADDAAHYSRLADLVRDAFVAEYVLPDGRMSSDAQTAYALALRFDLIVDPELRAAAGARLAALVAEGRNRISVGFAGVNVLSDALTLVDANDSAYDLLLEEECPSWLYAVKKGATTVWERWDSLLPDDTVNPGTMTSFNHYALGSVADWLHRVVAGIAPAAPGYRSIRFAPQPGGGLTSASAAHETPYGRASIDWRIADGVLSVDVVVPTGADAVVELPGAEPVAVGSGIHSFSALL